MSQAWAVQEMGRVDLGDARLNRRCIRLVSDLAAQPMASVPQACGDWAAIKGAYRFWDSEQVSAEAIRAAHRDSTLDRMAERDSVLVVQDTTNLDFAAHPKTKGIGPLDNAAQQGLKVHSALAISLAGVPLGLLHQQVWARDPAETGKRHRRRQLETVEKESQRWLTGLQMYQATLPPEVAVVTIADREADIYDLMVEPRRAGHDLLIRATHNRRVDHEASYLWEAIRSSPARGQLRIEVRRQENRPERQAVLTIRYLHLSVEPPRYRRQRSELLSVPVDIVLAEEETPPAGVTDPVCWLLITTLPVSSFEEAVQKVQWYGYRWLIERYHFVLKSGCRLEELQLETAARLERALATYCVVAWRLLWLTYEARRQPDIPCDTVLEAHEWQSLYMTIHKRRELPQQVPTLRQAVRWIAQLGGFLGRKSDGEPGVKTIWLGLRRLDDIAATWLLLQSPLPT